MNDLDNTLEVLDNSEVLDDVEQLGTTQPIETLENTVPVETIEEPTVPQVEELPNNFNNQNESFETVNNSFTYEQKTPEKETPNNYKTTNNKNYVSFEKRVLKLIIALLILTGASIVSFIGYRSFSKDKFYYTENSLANYQVCLKNNDYYEDSCLPEDMEYIAELTKTIRLDFNYNALFKEGRVGDYKYYIKSIITIQNDDATKNLFTKEKNLTEKNEYTLTQNVVSMSETIEVPYEDANKYAAGYLSNYALANNVNYRIALVIDDGEQEREVSWVDIPLTRQTYTITKNELHNQTGELITKSKNNIQYVFLLVFAFLFVPIVITILKLVSFVLKFRNTTSKYEKKLKEILVTYDRVIVTGKDNNIITKKDNIYEVKTFFELLDVRDTIDKPILYYKINSVKSEFYVQDVDTTYKYTMKESDFQ